MTVWNVAKWSRNTTDRLFLAISSLT
jgi:hypothetical protein